MTLGGYREGGGRPAGSSNLGPSTNLIKDIRQKVRQLCIDMDYDPLKELITIVQSESKPGQVLTLDQKILIHKELLQYVAPKLKSVDLQANVSGDIKINVVRFGDISQPPTVDVSEPTKLLQETVTEAVKEAIEDEEDHE